MHGNHELKKKKNVQLAGVKIRANGVKQATMSQIKEYQMQKHHARQTTCTLLTWRCLSRMFPKKRYVSRNPCDRAHSRTLTTLFCSGCSTRP